MGAVVVVVTDDPELESEPEDEGVDEPELEEVAPEVVDVVVDVRLDAEPEWATVSVATRAPRPTAADVAAIPMAAVIRRIRTMARSLASSAGRWSWRG
jgi:hypothetical protein